MESFIVAANTIVPMVLMIAVGCFAKKWNMISDKAVREANALCLKIFLSTLLFYNIYNSDPGESFNAKLVGYCVLGVFVQFFVGLLLIIRIEKAAPSRGVMLQAFFRANIGLLGIPFARSLFGESGVGETSLLLAVIVPLLNILSVVALEMFHGTKPDPVKILKGVLANPLVKSAAAGLVLACTGIRLPGMVESAVSGIAGATTPVALVLLGASLDFSQFRGNLRNVVICVVERLVVSPALFIGLAVLLGFRGVALGGIMIAFAAPVATASFTMAAEMGGDKDLAAELVLVTTCLSCFTLFGWIVLLKSLGLM